MTDYKNLKLIATSSPHIRAAENTRSIMLDVIIAMMPALIWAIVKFGFRALLLTAVSAAGCVFFASAPTNRWAAAGRIRIGLSHLSTACCEPLSQLR